MNCQRCNSDRVVNVNAKASDLFFVSIGEKEEDGYLPRDMGIGGGDYLDMSYCLDCGQIKGKFPLAPTELEKKEKVVLYNLGRKDCGLYLSRAGLWSVFEAREFTEEEKNEFDTSQFRFPTGWVLV